MMHTIMTPAEMQQEAGRREICDFLEANGFNSREVFAETFLIRLFWLALEEHSLEAVRLMVKLAGFDPEELITEKV